VPISRAAQYPYRRRSNPGSAVGSPHLHHTITRAEPRDGGSADHPSLRGRAKRSWSASSPRPSSGRLGETQRPLPSRPARLDQDQEPRLLAIRSSSKPLCGAVVRDSWGVGTHDRLANAAAAGVGVARRRRCWLYWLTIVSWSAPLVRRCDREGQRQGRSLTDPASASTLVWAPRSGDGSCLTAA
jgi:hypothetical protein